MNQNFYDKLNNVIAKDSILIDEPMSRHTTFRVGGPADYFVTPQSVDTKGEGRSKRCDPYL